MRAISWGRSHWRQIGWAALGTLACAACGGRMPAAKLRTAVVAKAGEATLNGATVERWLLGAPIAPSPAIANAFVSSWINSALVIDALRNNHELEDSATVDSIITTDAERGVIGVYFTNRLKNRPEVTAAQVDSLANTDRVRVYQQILLRYPGALDSASAMALANRGRELVKRARNGEDFTTLVHEASDDTTSRITDGYLPAVSRQDLQQLPQALRSIWNLQPGEISPLIPSPIGVHIFRRVTREQSRNALKTWLRPVLSRHADSVYVDSLVHSRQVQISPGAQERVRAIAAEPIVVSDRSPLATWKGGELNPELAREALLLGGPAVSAALRNGSDSLATSFLMELVRRTIVLHAITNERMPTAAARAELAPQYHTALAQLRTVFAALPASSSVGDAATQYLDSVFAKKNPERYYPLPGALSVLLRDRTRVTVDTAALQQLVEVALPAWRIAHANDSIPEVRRDTGVGPPAERKTPAPKTP